MDPLNSLYAEELDQFSTAMLSAISGNIEPLPDAPIDFFLSSHTLTEAIELGNTRCVAMLSQKYDDGQLPTMVPEGRKGEEAAVQSILNQPVALARKSGNMCTLLFVLVWDEVSKGKRELRVLNKLRDFVLSTKYLNVGGMLLSIQGNSSFALFKLLSSYDH